ncbi:MAG: hypothetical protein ABIY52_10675 [Gemmatimonadaceae bacterium]
MRVRIAVIRRCVAMAALLACASERLFAQHDHDMSSMAAPAWMLAFHLNANLTFDDQLTKRGDRELGLIDWEMFTASRDVTGGRLELRAMTSLEPLVLGGDGYPELLQTGGSYRGAVLHDRQHPHNAVMELAARYFAGPLSLYAGAVGEPALGPVAYLHRASSERDPFAPIGHHWQDASHQSFGVATIGLRARALMLEGSVFNAREADDKHLFLDYRDAKLDSYSGRLTWMPTRALSSSAWWGYIEAHDRLAPDSRMHRYGASVSFAPRLAPDRAWATTLIWGMNLHHHGGSAHELAHGDPGASPHHHASSLLAESSAELAGGRTVFGRAERVMKNGEELGFLGGDLTELYEVRSFSLGATQRVAGASRYELAVGGRGSVNVVPATLLATYGTRTPSGFAVYLQVLRKHQ